MQAENNNDIAITEAKLKDFLSSVLSSEGIVVDIRRTFIEYNGVNRSRVFARHANRMACKGSNEKFVVIALLCYPALQWLLKAQDIDALIEKLKEENEDESVWRMSNIQRILESSMGGCKPQLRLEMRKLFFARCQQLVDEIDEAMNKAVFMNPASKPSRISLAMAMLRGSILDSDPVTAVTIRNNFDSIVEDVTAIAGDAIKPLPTPTTFDPSGIEEDEDDSESFDMDSWLAEDVPENEPDIETEIELETEEPELSVEPKQESAETDSEPPAKKEIAPKPAGMESDQNGKKDKTPSDTENPVKVNAFTKQENPVPVEEKPAPKQKPAKASKAKTPKTPESGTSKPATAPAPAPAKKPEADNRNDASLFGRGFQNRTTKGSGGGKKKANQSKKPEPYSEGEQMRFDGI